MATVYSETNDGIVKKESNVNWATARDASSGDSVDSSSATVTQSVAAAAFAGRGATTYRVIRAFFEFDTSGITSTVDSATLKIRGVTYTAADFFVVKSTQSSSLATSDFDNISGWSSGDNSSNVTKYSSEVTSWTTSGYNDISLNSDALSDMVSLSTFKICCIEADYDLVDTAPSTSGILTGMYFTESSGTSNDPYIDYTLAAVTAADNAVFFGTNF